MGGNLKLVSTFGWFADLLVLVPTVKLPTTLEAFISNTLEARCV